MGYLSQGAMAMDNIYQATDIRRVTAVAFGYIVSFHQKCGLHWVDGQLTWGVKNV